MTKPLKAAEDRRVVINPDHFGPAELLALSKILDPKCKAVTDARAEIATAVHQVDVTVRIVGDIEVGVGEKVQDKISTEKYLIAALSFLTPVQRKKVLSKNPGGPKAAKALAAVELKTFKGKLPKHDGPQKLTPHLTVTRAGMITPI
jgi:hypothetical protein